MNSKAVKWFAGLSVLFAAVLCVNAALSRFYVTPVLMYHHIDGDAEQTKLSVSPASFTRQMAFLKRRGYRVLSLGEYVRLLKSGEQPRRKSAVITFDDGYEDNYRTAAPILKQMGFPATVFVQLNGIGREGYLTETQMRELPAWGLEIGSHTLHHAFLPDIAGEERVNEIAGSKKILEEKLGRPVKLFSYPGGGFDAAARQIVIDSGYDGAVATHPGRGYPRADPYALKRIRISRTADNPIVFWLQVSGFYTYIEEARG